MREDYWSAYKVKSKLLVKESEHIRWWSNFGPDKKTPQAKKKIIVDITKLIDTEHFGSNRKSAILWLNNIW